MGIKINKRMGNQARADDGGEGMSFKTKLWK